MTNDVLQFDLLKVRKISSLNTLLVKFAQRWSRDLQSESPFHILVVLIVLTSAPRNALSACFQCDYSNACERSSVSILVSVVLQPPPRTVAAAAARFTPQERPLMQKSDADLLRQRCCTMATTMAAKTTSAASRHNVQAEEMKSARVCCRRVL